MNIINRTQSQIHYDTNAPGAGDSGFIAPGETAYLDYGPDTTWTVTLEPSDPATFTFNAVAGGGNVEITTNQR